MNPIIIIGAGFGGIAAAYALGRMRRKLGGHPIILIDKYPAHLYTPLLYEVAAGFDPDEFSSAPSRDFERKLEAGAGIAYEAIGRRLGKLGVSLRQEEVLVIDWQKRELASSDGKRLNFYALICATGSETEYFGIPGLKEHANPIKSIRHSLAMRRALLELLKKKKSGALSRPISVVVAGAGPTGVEFSGELALFFRKAVKNKIIGDKDYKIWLIEAGNLPLAQFGSHFSFWAAKRLEKLGVKLRFGAILKEVRTGSVIIEERAPQSSGKTLICGVSVSGREELPADLRVWTGGVRGSSFAEKVGLPVNKKGRVPVELSAEVPRFENVYVIGDQAEFTDTKTGHPVPWLAQSAIAEAKIAAYNIAASTSGGAKRLYGFPYLHAVIPIGGKFALADVNGIKFSGFFGWVARQLADIRYFISILGVWAGFRVWFLGLAAYIGND